MDEFDALCAHHLRHAEGGRAIGRSGTINVEYYLDLLSATHDPGTRVRCAQYLAAAVKRWQDETQSAVDCVASPKSGNCLLVAELAARLGTTHVTIRDSTVFGASIEGLPDPRSRVLIADDVSSDGRLLLECVRGLKAAGHDPIGVFVLVERSEGNARRVLASEGISLMRYREFDDATLQVIIAEYRRHGLPARDGG